MMRLKYIMSSNWLWIEHDVAQLPIIWGKILLVFYEDSLHLCSSIWNRSFFLNLQIGREIPGKNAFKFTKTHSLVTFIQDEVMTKEKKNISKIDAKIDTILTEGTISSLSYLI